MARLPFAIALEELQAYLSPLGLSGDIPYPRTVNQSTKFVNVYELTAVS